MSPKLPRSVYRRQILGLTVIGLLILSFQLYFSFFKSKTAGEPVNIVFSEASTGKTKAILAEFDPNDLDLSQWKNLGFTERQATGILNYKRSLGGAFTSREQLKKAYSIPPEKFSELEPYLLLPAQNATEHQDFSYRRFAGKELNISKKFNPDNLNAAQWVAMGFTEKQAQSILKYKNYLGGSFKSKENLKKCFMISEANYRKMEPFLLLPETDPRRTYSFSSEHFERPEPAANKVKLVPFDPNLLDEVGWQQLGFSERQAASILKYKNKMQRGTFHNIEEIAACYMIKPRFEELKPFIRLNAETQQNTGEKIPGKIAETAVKTDFSKLDLNNISYRELVEFGFTEKAAGSYVGYRKSLGGFVNKSQIFETYGIDRETAERLATEVPLRPGGAEMYTLASAPESWLKTHPYFRYSADKIIFYRISNPDDRKIWKYLKLKPEYEEKMRLYIR